MKMLASLASSSLAALLMLACGGAKPGTTSAPNPAPTSGDAKPGDDAESDEDDGEELDETDDSGSGDADDDEQPGDEVTKVPTESCTQLRGTAPLDTIQNFVTLLNKLPRPLTVPCVVEALPRPLGLRATTSKLGAQPANGPDDPRIFAVSGGLVLSIVAGGPGSEAIELAETTSEDRSIKGDLRFPMVGRVADDAPYAKIYEPATGKTTCTAICHGDATKLRQVGDSWAVESIRIRHSDFTDVRAASVQAIAQRCKTTAGDAASVARCRILKALFQGEAYEFDFPPSVKPQF